MKKLKEVTLPEGKEWEYLNTSCTAIQGVTLHFGNLENGLFFLRPLDPKSIDDYNESVVSEFRDFLDYHEIHHYFGHLPVNYSFVPAEHRVCCVLTKDQLHKALTSLGTKIGALRDDHPEHELLKSFWRRTPVRAAPPPTSRL